MVDLIGLGEWLDHPVEALSKGMAQKVQFIAAVVSRPELVILDEPFSGLDPVNADVLRDAVLALRRQGTTVVFSTHDMSVAEKMCDRIFMIFRGRKVLDGTLAEIQAAYGADTIRVRIDGAPALLTALPGVVGVNDYGQLQEMRATAATRRCCWRPSMARTRRQPLRGHPAVAARHLRAHCAARRGRAGPRGHRCVGSSSSRDPNS